MQDQQLQNLCEKIADALGFTTDEIMDSERFEQAVYDMAKTEAKLDDKNFSGHASFYIDHNNDRVEVSYNFRVNASAQKLAEFYHKHFPETNPNYVYGIVQTISFAREPFMQKVLPTMKLWRSRPSCIADNALDYVDSNTMLLTSPLKPEFGSAVFITGSDPKLGEWKTAMRLNFNEATNAWECKLPAGLKNTEFKFMTGAYALGESASVGQLTYASGANRMLVIHAPVSVDREIPLKPTGYGVRC